MVHEDLFTAFFRSIKAVELGNRATYAALVQTASTFVTVSVALHFLVSASRLDINFVSLREDVMLLNANFTQLNMKRPTSQGFWLLFKSSDMHREKKDTTELSGGSSKNSHYLEDCIRTTISIPGILGISSSGGASEQHPTVGIFEVQGTLLLLVW